MDAQLGIVLSILFVTPFWLGMLFVPKQTFVRRVIASPWSLAASIVLYLVAAAMAFPAIMDFFANPDLSDMTAATLDPVLAAPIWAHMLAMDLVAGRWVYLNTRTDTMNRFFRAFVLFMTFWTGPIGIGIYLIHKEITDQHG